jgi:hypothetical protein
MGVERTKEDEEVRGEERGRRRKEHEEMTACKQNATISEVNIRIIVI